MSAFLKRVAACAAASVMIVGGAVLPSQASEPEYGSVEQRSNATITIHKMVSGSLTTDNVTADVDNGQGAGLIGVPFKLFRLNV